MPRLLALLRELVRFSSAGVAPRKLLVCGTHLRNRRRAAHPHQPGEIARTHTAMRSRRRPPPARRAPFSRTQLHPASQAAHNHSVRRAVWRTNTHTVGPAHGGRGGTGRTAHARRVPAQRRHGGVPARPRLPTASQLHGAPCAAHYLQRRPHTPAGQRVPSVRLVASLLCTCLSAASAPDQRPATAKLHHPLHSARTALQPAVRTPGLPMTHTGDALRGSVVLLTVTRRTYAKRCAP